MFSKNVKILLSFWLMLFAFATFYGNVISKKEKTSQKSSFYKKNTPKVSSTHKTPKEETDFIEFEREIESFTVASSDSFIPSKIEILDLRENFSCRFCKKSFYQKTPLYNLYCRYKIF